ncbi:hypothetical protein XdyCFBP7245_07255 [Xanthomonas dyei]|uniref:Uncharacterized protein n=1 Tax=Xanthomonas dyei TaxID=743699 RepID=A0A2S7C6K7_9XANT|nr:hypothetical protein XdyCFBP7245_07255 [Xanthomonas dyei]
MGDALCSALLRRGDARACRSLVFVMHDLDVGIGEAEARRPARASCIYVRCCCALGVVHAWCDVSRFAGALTPTPAPRPSPRLRRGRSKARAPVPRKPCLLAPAGAGLWLLRTDRSCVVD